MTITPPLRCSADPHLQGTAAPMSCEYQHTVGACIARPRTTDGRPYAIAIKERMSLRASAHTGVATRIPNTDLWAVPLNERQRTDRHTSDVGHWFEMTAVVGPPPTPCKCPPHVILSERSESKDLRTIDGAKIPPRACGLVGMTGFRRWEPLPPALARGPRIKSPPADAGQKPYQKVR